MMDTDALIRALAADSRRRAAPLSALWWAAAAAAVAIAGILFLLVLGPRPDFAHAAETPRFLLKFVITAVLAAGAFGAVRTLSRPEGDWRAALPLLIAAPALVLMAVAAELALVPSSRWVASLIGDNSLDCLTFIPMLGVGPLAVFVFVLRQGAPARPRLAGAVAGLLAGGIAATFYAAKCTDDSPLFVGTWYTLAIAALACAGALGAGRFARW